MPTARLITLGILAVAIVISVALQWGQESQGVKTVDDSSYHQASYPLKDFYPGIEQSDFNDAIADQVLGGIVSHHLLAAQDIARFFAELRSQNPSTIVLIGPNHFSVGRENISISRQSFKTPWGDVNPNDNVIDRLVERRSVSHNEEPFIEEHSIASLVSYIAYNFPDSTIVPIVIKREVARTQLDRLASDLDSLLPADAVVVASVDFSHHLNRVATEFHDVASVSTIASFDLDRLFGLEIDSPPSIYTLLKYLDARGARRFTFKNTDSTDYTGNAASEDLTSYVFGHFVRGDVTGTTSVTSLHFGDTMLGRDVATFIDGGGDPFQKIQGVEGNFLRGVDVTVANLEGVIVDPEDCHNTKEVLLLNHHETPDLLRRYNFSGVSLANNHRLDCYETGLRDTVSSLEEKGLFALLPPTTEDLRVIEQRVGDHRLAIVGLDVLGLEENDLASRYAQLTALKSEYDSLIVHVHWGYEYDRRPSLEQQRIGHDLIDAGVDAVIGHHPHVVQPVERYKEGIIFYSLGNFIFDQASGDTSSGFGVGLVHDDEPISGYLFPYEIEDFQPALLPYGQMERYCADVLAELEGDVPCSF